LLKIICRFFATFLSNVKKLSIFAPALIEKGGFFEGMRGLVRGLFLREKEEVHIHIGKTAKT